MVVANEQGEEPRELRASDDYREYRPDRRAIPLVDDEGEPISLEEALRKRDELCHDPLHRRGSHRRDDESMSSIEAAKRLGRLQAQLALIGRDK